MSYDSELAMIDDRCAIHQVCNPEVVQGHSVHEYYCDGRVVSDNRELEYFWFV